MRNKLLVAVAATVAAASMGTSAAADTSTSRLSSSEDSVQILWLRDFTSPLDDWINDILPMRDGNYLAAGFLNRADTGSDWRALAVKLNTEGSIAWQREHGAGGGVDAYWGVHEAADGRFALAGFTTRIGAGGIDAYFSTLTADGWIVKENAYGGPKYDRVTDLAPAADGGYVLAGMTESFGAGKRDILLLKVDAGGIEQWRRIYGEAGNDAALYIEAIPDGGFVIAGGTEGAGEDGQVLVMKVDSEGKELWRRTIGESTTPDINHGLVLLADGRIFVPAYSKSWGAQDNDVLAAVLKPTGEIERIDVIGGGGDDRPMSARPDARGIVWIAGYTKSIGAGGWDVLLTAYDPGRGFTDVFTAFGGAEDDNGTMVQPLADGSLLVAGYSKSLSAQEQDAFLMRVARPQKTKLPKDVRRRKAG
jgi:hypothetical protein